MNNEKRGWWSGLKKREGAGIRRAYGVVEN